MVDRLRDILIDLGEWRGRQTESYIDRSRRMAG